MAMISDKLNKILSAVFGKDVRQALYDGLDAINKETENTTKRQTFLEKVFEQLTINAGNSNAEIVAGRVRADGTAYETIGKRLDSNDTQLAENTNMVRVGERALNYWWIPPQQPPARTDMPNHFIDAYSAKVDTVISKLEELRLANPNYISRSLKGNDQSGTLPWYVYYLNAKSPKKKIIITTSQHGSEKTNVFIMLRFLHYLCNESDKYPQFAKIREEVSIVYVPFYNPWGFNNNRRQNSRGVDLARNFDYKWDDYVCKNPEPFGHDYKGTSAMSEIESQYMKAVLNENLDATMYLDLHNTGVATDHAYISRPTGYTPKFTKKMLNWFVREIENPKVRDVVWDYPAQDNWLYSGYKIPCLCVEWNDCIFGVKTYDDIEITKGLEWVSNWVFEIFREHSGSIPSFKSIRKALSKQVSSTNYSEITEVSGSTKIYNDGIAIYEGTITISGNANNDCGISIVPLFAQYGNGSGMSYNDVRTSLWENIGYTTGTNTITVPFRAIIPVKKTNETDGVGNLSWGLTAMRKTDYSPLIYRFNATVKILPYEVCNLEYI